MRPHRTGPFRSGELRDKFVRTRIVRKFQLHRDDAASGRTDLHALPELIDPHIPPADDAAADHPFTLPGVVIEHEDPELPCLSRPKMSVPHLQAHGEGGERVLQRREKELGDQGRDVAEKPVTCGSRIVAQIDERLNCVHTHPAEQLHELRPEK